MQQFDYINKINTFSPEIIEKKAIKKHALHIGITVIVLFGIMFFWSVPIMAVTTLIGLPADKVLEILNDPFVSNMLQILLSVVMIFLPFFVLGKIKFDSLTDGISFRLPKKRMTVPFIMAGVAFCLFVSSASGMFSSVLESIGITVPEVEMQLPTGVFGILSSVIATVLIPAFVEEFAMRGVVLGVFRRFGDAFAIFVSAFVFGIMHASIHQIPFAFILGLFFGIMVIKTESIWPAVLLHAINNGIAVAYSYLELYLGTDTVNIFYTVFVSILFVLSIAGIVLLLHRDNKALEIKTAQTQSSEKQKIMWFIFSPMIIICTLISLAFGLLLR